MPEDRTREGDGATRDERRAFPPVTWLWRATVRRQYVGGVPVPSGPAVAAGRTAWRYCPPASPGGSFFLLPAVFLAQPLGHLVEHRTFGRGQALQPLERDLVEHTVELGHPLLARRHRRHQSTCHRTWLLRRDCLALRDDLIDVVTLRTVARSRERARDRTRRLVLRIVGGG